jgi:hypothetical protein
MFAVDEINKKSLFSVTLLAGGAGLYNYTSLDKLALENVCLYRK